MVYWLERYSIRRLIRHIIAYASVNCVETQCGGVTLGQTHDIATLKRYKNLNQHLETSDNIQAGKIVEVQQKKYNKRKL